MKKVITMMLVLGMFITNVQPTTISRIKLGSKVPQWTRGK